MSQKILHTVAIYPGRFHGFHTGHLESFKQLQKKFGKKNTYIVLSEKYEPGSDQWPFPAEDRKQLLAAMGVDEDKIMILDSRDPYSKQEVLNKFDYDKETTLVVFGVADKDMGSKPRFTFGKTKSGKETHFQKYNDDIENDDKHPIGEHSFVFVTTTREFGKKDEFGEGMKGASEIRKKYKESENDEERIDILKDAGYKSDVIDTVKEIFDRNLLDSVDLEKTKVKEHLRQMIKSLINENQEAAILHLKSYLIQKMN